MKALWIFAALIVATLFLLSGCKPKEEEVVAPPCSVGSVQIVMPADTLRFIPGDSASAEGFVTVKDDQQNVMPGIQVTFEVTNSFGVIEFVHSDTTDSGGQVYFWFRSFLDVQGVDTIHVRACDKEASWPITLRAAGFDPFSINLSLSRPLLTSLNDSLIARVIIVDSGFVGVPDITPLGEASGGHMTPFPPTDSHGQSKATWYPTEYGKFTITARFGMYTATDTVTVADTTGGHSPG